MRIPEARRTLNLHVAEASALAAIVFLTTLVAGAGLLVAAKLQFPGLGSGASPFDILKAIGLIGIASLGATINLDGLQLSTIPLGMLALVGGASLVVAAQSLREGRLSNWDIPLVGGWLGLFASVASLVFRFGGDAEVAASPGAAFVFGFIWGSVFAALGWWWHGGRVRIGWNRALGNIVSVAKRVALVIAFGGTVAVLCLVIVRLATDPLPRGFGIGDAVAALIYLVAFLPNLVIAIFSFAVGATLEVGAQLEIAGETVGPLRTLSLWHWDGGEGIGWLLLALPAGTAFAAGVAAERTAPSRHGMWAHLAGTALIVGAGVAALAGLGDARLGAGLVRERGVASIAVDALEAGALASLWVGGGGLAAAYLIRFRRAEERRA